MIFGLLAESDYDAVIITEIIKKIVNEVDPSLSGQTVIFHTYEANGTVIPKMDVATSLFFSSKDKVDILVFGVDLDGKSKERKRKVNDFIKKRKETNPHEQIVPLFTEPHIEQLFFNGDDNAIKSVLSGLAADQPLPNQDLSAKGRLAELVKQFSPKELSSTKTDIYREITTKLDLNQISNTDSNFKKFKKDLTSEIKSLTTKR